MTIRSGFIRNLLWALCSASILISLPAIVKAQVGDAPPQRLVQVEPGSEVFGGLGLMQIASRNGRVVAFTPFVPTRLVGFPQEIPPGQVLLLDRDAGTIEVATRTPSGGFHTPNFLTKNWISMSDDGRFLAFTSASTNLDPAANLGFYTTFLYDRVSHSVRAIDLEPGQRRGYGLGAIDGQGRTAVIQCRGLVGIPLQGLDIGLCRLDLASGEVRLLRRFSLEYTLGFRLSRDGRWVLLGYSGPILTTGAPNVPFRVHVYVMSTETGAVELISAAPDGSPGNGGNTAIAFSISDDGDFVAFFTGATNLLPGGNPPLLIAVKQRSTGILRFAGPQGFAGPRNPVLSGDGRRLLYSVLGGGGDQLRIYDWETNSIRVASGAPGGIPNGPLCDLNDNFYYDNQIALSGDGRTIVYPSMASNLVAGDVPNTCDLFVRQLGPVPQPAMPVVGPNRAWLAALALLMGLAAIIAVRRIG
jgi:hypothetical protein